MMPITHQKLPSASQEPPDLKRQKNHIPIVETLEEGTPVKLEKHRSTACKEAKTDISNYKDLPLLWDELIIYNH